MNTIITTAEFSGWLNGLKDTKAKARITARIDSAEAGNFGVCKVLTEGVREMKVDVGPGYRIYYVRRGLCVYMLLCGGDKSTQTRDIKRAIQMARSLK